MGATLSKPISRTKRILSLIVFLVATVVVLLDLRANPQFGPPIVFGFGLGLVGLAAGAVLASVIIGWRWFRHADVPAGAGGSENPGSRREA
jgi:hypothetical protein